MLGLNRRPKPLMPPKLAELVTELPNWEQPASDGAIDVFWRSYQKLVDTSPDNKVACVFRPDDMAMILLHYANLERPYLGVEADQQKVKVSTYVAEVLGGAGRSGIFDIPLAHGRYDIPTLCLGRTETSPGHSSHSFQEVDITLGHLAFTYNALAAATGQITIPMENLDVYDIQRQFGFID